MVIKDEADSGYGNLHICTPTKSLDTWANMPSDFWGPMSNPPFAGPQTPPDNTRAEGPGGILIGEDWFIYADYWMDGQTRVWRANDFMNITTTEDMHLSRALRHGTMFRAEKADVEALLNR